MRNPHPSRPDQRAAMGITRPDARDVFANSLYHFQAYAAAGAAQLQFFNVGFGSAAGGKDDTNLEVPNQLQAGQTFEYRAIEIHFFPGVEVAAYGAGAIASFARDVYAVGKAGRAEFVISSKTVLIEGPIGRMPPSTRMVLDAALSDASTAAVAQQSRIAYAAWGGPLYTLTPDVIRPTEAFNITLYNLPALPSAVAGRIGVVLQGVLSRRT